MGLRGVKKDGYVEISRVAGFFCSGDFGEFLQTPSPLRSPHELVEFVFAKMRLEHVRPDSAFWSSEMSRGVTRKPCASMRARVRRKDAGKMIVPPSAIPSISGGLAIFVFKSVETE